MGVKHVRKNGLLCFVNSFRVPWLPLELVMPRAQPYRTQETCVHNSLGRSPHFLWYSDAHTGTYWVPALGSFFLCSLATVLETPIYGRQGAYTEGEIKTRILCDFCLCLYPLALPPWEAASMGGCGSHPLVHCNLALDNSPTT